MKKLLSVLLILMLALSLTACATVKDTQEDKGKETQADTKEDDIYLTLVNKCHKLPENWTEMITLETAKNSLDEEYQVEKVTLENFNKLREDLLKEDIDIELDSTYRTVKEQQEIWDSFSEKYGLDYTKKYVAVPGHSEHHTGLVIDIFLIKDGKEVRENDDMMKETEIFSKVHEKLADYGFILRYLKGKEQVTGYNYEPWHLRYVGKDAAKEIYDEKITLEEYLGVAVATDVKIDLGKSEIYTDEQLEEAVAQIKCKFAEWEGCLLQSITYAGDDCNSEENIKWVNSLKEGTEYTGAMKFLTDFHSAKDGESTLDPDKDYKDYEWWLACDKEGSWDIVSSGY